MNIQELTFDPSLKTYEELWDLVQEVCRVNTEVWRAYETLYSEFTIMKWREGTEMAKMSELTEQTLMKRMLMVDSKMNRREMMDNLVLQADRSGFDGPYPCPTCNKFYFRHQYDALVGEERKRLYTHVRIRKLYRLTCLECSEKRALLTQ